MPQFLTIGGFTCDADSAWFTIRRTGLVGGTGRINRTRNVWEISGRVNGITPSAVDTKVVALESAVMDGIDLVFSLGSSMNLLSRNCAEGTHVREFRWLPGYDGVRGSGAEGVLRRTFHLVVYGDVIDTSDTDYTSYSDQLTFIGNGSPNVVPVTSLNGPVQPQQIETYTPVWILQTGQATGLTTTPPAATPQFIGTGYYPPSGINLSYFTPRKYGINQNTEFGVRWAYRCWISNYVQGYVPPSF